MKRTAHETDGKFAITKFAKVKQYETAANDRGAWLDICDAHNVDGSVYSAPAGFAKWAYSEQAARVVAMFNLQPVAVSINVLVAA